MIFSIILKYEWYIVVRVCVFWRTSYLSAIDFLKQHFCFHIMPYYDRLSYSHTWIIDKLDTQRNGFFLSMF